MAAPELTRLQITNNVHIEILNHHVNIIMQSQLLLDEDQEIISTYWSPLAIEVHRNHMKWVNSAISLSGTMIGIRCKSWQLVVASCIPTAIKTILDCYKGLRLRKHKKCFEKLISLLKEQYDLNRHICEHFQKRTTALLQLSDRLKSDFICLLIRKHETEFAVLAISNVLKICLDIQKNLTDISKNLGLEEEAYSFMCNWDLESFFPSGDKSLFELFENFSHCYDVYRLLMSSFLGCVALSFSINIWRDAEKFDAVLYNNIPKLTYNLEKYITQIKDKFDTLRYCLIEQPAPKRTYHASIAKRSILIQPLTDCIRNIQLTFDITRSLQQKLIDNQISNPNDLTVILEDLLKHNKSTSESIEIVLKMNNVVAKKDEKEPAVQPQVPEPKQDSVEVLMSIRHDDPDFLGEDEVYSLSPWESDEELMGTSHGKTTDKNAHFEDLIMCVASQKMLIKELREKLKLIREKKLLPLEEETHKKEKRYLSPPPLIRPIPQRRMSVPTKESLELINNGTKRTPNDCGEPVPQCSWAPDAVPPSPPPLVDFQNLMPELSAATHDADSTLDFAGAKNFVDTISSIAKSLKRPEETFGSSSDSDEEDESNDE